MFRAWQSRLSQTLLVLLMPVAFLVAPIGASPAAADVVRTALIDESTVSGSPSQEEAIAIAAGFEVTVVSDATWEAMTAAEFGAYDLLIAGDPTCDTLPSGLINSAPTYGPVVLGHAGGRSSAGNRIVVGTDPVFHDGGDYTSAGARGTIIRDGIAFAGSRPGTTGMYFDATCAAYSQSADILAILGSLSAGVGAWTIHPADGNIVSLIASNPAFVDLTTASLENWSYSVHESFPTFPTDWSALAIATDAPTAPTCGNDPSNGGAYACGEAYILIAGSAIVVSSQGISVTPLDATNPTGTSHTVTANVHDTGGPLSGQLVTFSVTGQNAGATGICAPVDCKTDSSGDVTFTYTGAAGVGDDTIKATFTDETGSLQTATAQKHWVAAPAQAHLTLVKLVDNTGGGTASVGDWTLSANGPTPISGHTGDVAITNAPVDPGNYTLSESPGPSGFAGSWSCTGDGLAGETNILLAAGGTATCTITNTFIRPQLTLTKTVVGGTALATAWTLSASGGPTPTSGNTGDAAITNHTMDAGTYTLSESPGPSGYSPSPWLCSGGSLVGSSLTLAGGDTASCSITNTIIPPAHLTLVKTVINTGGGTTAATAWTLTATGPPTISGHTGDATITNASVPAGTYALTETGGPATGYAASAWSCSAGTLTLNSHLLAPGASATCTITNTFNASTNTSTTATCPPTQTCTTAPITSPGVGTVVTITGAAGSTIVAEFDPFTTGTFVPCKDQKPRDPNNILSFDANTGTKTIQMTVSGKGPVPICWNSPTKFKQRDGHDAHFNSTLHVYYGLLPDCKGKHPVAPCVLSTVTSSPPPHHDEHGHPKPPPPPPTTTTVRILAPFGDPKLRA